MALAHDGRGNTTDSIAEDYTFTLANELKTVASPSTGFTYDPMGRLSGIGGNTFLLYDGGDLIAEYSSGGAIQRRYIHGPGMDEPLVWYEGGGTGTKRYYVADQLGSIVAVTDATGAPIDLDDSGGTDTSRSYDEYGNASPAVGDARFGYTGQAWIEEASAWYYKARFYDPKLGRFLSPDPIGYGDGANMYAYVGNDPVNLVDPSGLEAAGWSQIIGYDCPEVEGTCVPIYEEWLSYDVCEYAPQLLRCDFETDDFIRYASAYLAVERVFTGRSGYNEVREGVIQVEQDQVS